MKRTLNITRFIPRAAITLVLMLLTAATAWATDVTVTYNISVTGTLTPHADIKNAQTGQQVADWEHGVRTLWPANEGHTTRDYQITFTPDQDLDKTNKNDYNQTASCSAFKTERTTVFTVATAMSGYYVKSVTFKEDDTVKGDFSGFVPNSASVSVTLQANKFFNVITVVLTNDRYYSLSPGSGLTLNTMPTLTYRGTPYFLSGNAVSMSATNQSHIIEAVSGIGSSTPSIAADKRSFTFTMPQSDVYPTATLTEVHTMSVPSGFTVSDPYISIGGTPYYKTGSTVTLTVADADKAISGTGAVTSSPWAADFAASIQRVNIGSADLTISGNPFSTLGAAAVIVVPTPAYAVDYSSAAYASKLRVALGDYLFTATDEGGTAAYAIATEADLRNLAAAVNATDNISSGKTFCQTADIAMTGGNFDPIGRLGASNSFMGTYDGQGHAISGLTVSNGYRFFGLFGSISGATVRNVLLVSPTATTTVNDYVNLDALIGYCGSGETNNTVENCVVVSPTLSSSGTGSNNYVGAIIGRIWGVTNVTNCYYYDNTHDYATVGYYDSDGHLTNVARARRITLGSGVTAVSPAASDPANGFQYGGSDYYREGLALTLTTSAPATVPDGYTYTVSANSTALSGTTYTVNATDGDATLAAIVRSDGQQHEVSYVDADGTEHHETATFLDGYETVISQYGSQYIDLAAGWYYVGADITYTNVKIRPQGAINLILGNGKTMHIGTADNPTGLTGIVGSTENLTIYGQSLDNATAGTLSYVGTGGNGIYVSDYTQHIGNVSISNSPYTGYGIEANRVTIKGDTLTVATNADGAKAILASLDITISGGTVDARATGSGDLCGIHSKNGTITLGWTHATDRITASSYSGTVKVADGNGNILTDGSGNILTGTLAADDVNGKTLRPVINSDVIALGAGQTEVALPHFSCLRNLTAPTGEAKDAVIDGENAYVYTLCLPYAPVKEENLKFYTLSGVNGSSLQFTEIVGDPAADTPYLVAVFAGSNAEEGQLGMTDVTLKKEVAGASAGGYTMKGTTTGLSHADALGKYILQDGNVWGQVTDSHTNVYIPPFRAYIEGTAGAAIRLGTEFEEDDEATGINALQLTDRDGTEHWYDLSGRAIEKPTKGGVYIRNNKKVLVK
ncbi:MAG: hypothetical protein IJ635_03625 [Bacteroidaceae bacterium]|nr:hypothetical protein [Bacteroidaceae bacterium]